MDSTVQTFMCYHCRQQSRFIQRVRDESGLLWTLREQSNGEQRVYLCEHCATENQISRQVAAWASIDTATAPLPEVPPNVGRPVEDNTGRDRLEEDLGKIRTQSAVVGTLAGATGIGIAAYGASPTATPGGLHTLRLVLTTVVSIVAFVNSIPLRQTSNPALKNTQLRRALTWRHRLLVSCAMSTALLMLISAIEAMV